MLTFVGAIRRYRNDPLLLLSLLSPIVFISVKGAFDVVLQRSKTVIKLNMQVREKRCGRLGFTLTSFQLMMISNSSVKLAVARQMNFF